MKSNKDFYRFISNKMKTGESVDPLLNGTGQLVIKDTEITEVLISLFPSVSTHKTGLQKYQDP